MASLRSIRTRIKSVRNTQKITKAMKLVDAAKLRGPQAREVAQDLIAEFTSGRIDGAFLLYNQFKSAISQQITLTQLLPIEAPPEQQQQGKGFVTPEHLFEPGRRELLEQLIPKQLAIQIWRALLESKASEHGARMTAMDAATKNAGEMIGRLSLEYN